MIATVHRAGCSDHAVRENKIKKVLANADLVIKRAFEGGSCNEGKDFGYCTEHLN